MLDLKDKVVIITGAAGEPGLSITKTVLTNSGKACMVDVKRDKLENIAEHLFREFGKENVTYFDCDVTHDKLFECAFSHARCVFGTVDILVNAASVKNESDWKKNINVNLGAVLNCSKIAYDYFITFGINGVIVNVATAAGVNPERYTDMPTSVASEAGVVAYTQCIANKSKYVRTVCLCWSTLERRREPLRMTGTTDVISESTESSPYFETLAKVFHQVVSEDTKSGSVVVVEDDIITYM